MYGINLPTWGFPKMLVPNKGICHANDSNQKHTALFFLLVQIPEVYTRVYTGTFLGGVNLRITPPPCRIPRPYFFRPISKAPKASTPWLHIKELYNDGLTLRTFGIFYFPVSHHSIELWSWQQISGSEFGLQTIDRSLSCDNLLATLASHVNTSMSFASWLVKAT